MLVNREKFRYELDKLDCIDKFGYVVLPITKLNIALERSTVDAVPVVRCKDCKHRPMLENPVGKQYGFNVIAPEDKDGWEDNTCPYLVDDGFYSRYPSDDDFCSCGERRK